MTGVDTTILLDVLVNDPQRVERSDSLLVQAYEQGSLIIAPAVYVLHRKGKHHFSTAR